MRLPREPGIYAGKDATGNIKIGMTTNLQSRSAKYYTENPTWKLIDYLETDTIREAKSLESWIHHELRGVTAYRQSNEWFKSTAETRVMSVWSTAKLPKTQREEEQRKKAEREEAERQKERELIAERHRLEREAEEKRRRQQREAENERRRQQQQMEEDCRRRQWELAVEKAYEIWWISSVYLGLGYLGFYLASSPEFRAGAVTILEFVVGPIAAVAAVAAVSVYAVFYLVGDDMPPST